MTVITRITGTITAFSQPTVINCISSGLKRDGGLSVNIFSGMRRVNFVSHKWNG